MKNKRAIATLELSLIILSLFAFAYLISLTEPLFQTVSALDPYDVNSNGILDTEEEITAEEFMTEVFDTDILESETKTAYTISREDIGAGCCEISGSNQCVTSIEENCDGQFAEGVLCSQTSFCEMGCCYNEDTGVYDSGVLKTNCQATWKNDQFCNMPEADLGCCVLGTASRFVTEGQCKVYTSTMALGGEDALDWRANLDEAECVMLSMAQERGACVLDSGDCKFITGEECSQLTGDFNLDFLCTSPSLNTNCKITEKTTCIEGRDEVFFTDSCGNPANIYDSLKAADPNYWDKVEENICGEGSGNGDSSTCGNCNRFLGGICASASENNFNVDVGDFYCKDTSCEFDGVQYKNGESWCVYDGSIGEGTDVVGSRHWRYVCSQGTAIVEPCADYRNQICIQSNTVGENGQEVEFRNSACVINNWRACINLNSEEDGLESCEDTLNCRVEKVEISDYFKFDVCLPKYPGGFSFTDERYIETAEDICIMGSQKCSVIYEPRTWGGCKLVANAGCLDPKFAEEMNNFCTGLGDCGGSVNIAGDYQPNYKVTNSPELSSEWISKLKALAIPVPGQFAEVEDYEAFLEAAGNWANPEEVPGVGVSGGMESVGSGVAGIGMAAYYVSGTSFVGGMTGVAVASYANIAIGAGIGMVAGAMLAKKMGTSPGGSILMAVGGAIIGAAVGVMILAGKVLTTACAFGPWGCVAGVVIGAIIMIIGAIFGGDDCPPVEVTFECNKWQPKVGGEDCEICNDNPLKPCSEYRCHSLGAACELVNQGTENEICVSSEDDGKAPVLSPQYGMISAGEYSATSDGFEIKAEGNCLEANTRLVFGVTTDEPALCKYSEEPEDFKNMTNFGSSSYLKNHTVSYPLLDPSQGQSQGIDIKSEETLYIKCQDTHGHENLNFYKIQMCVNEGEDISAPIITATIPKDEAFIGTQENSKEVVIITNEVSECKWDTTDQDFSSMTNSMQCDTTFGSPSSISGYICKANLQTEQKQSTFYFRCKDQPWLGDSVDRHEMTTSKIYKLQKPNKKIEIDWIKPTGNISSPTDLTTINLQIMTSGGGNYHRCLYSFTGYEKMVELLQTGLEKPHSWQLSRPIGKHKIYVECTDELGESVQGWTEFEIVKNNLIVKIKPIENSITGKAENEINLEVQTSGGGEKHSCSYSINDEEIEHEFDNQDIIGKHNQKITVGTGKQTVSVKCSDELGNIGEDNVKFEMTYDETPPVIARIWQSDNNLYIVTIGDDECRYSNEDCNFNWDNATSSGKNQEHIIKATRGKTYYIKCQDKFGNTPSGCSVTTKII